MDDLPATVPDLACRIGVDQKRMRAWLRRQGWRSPGEHGTRWALDAEQVRQVEAHFSTR
ncbi:hypothetical protein [Clavibacter zhangzhiyongii]|uniref:hypothetical protein n=1 Tax=Clavibacter TaxID=1573 RepID=UPI0039E1F319